jgi:hypothetical protein
MSIAAALLLAAAAPQAAKSAPPPAPSTSPARPSQAHGPTVAIASATAVILRPAVVSLDRSGANAASRTTPKRDAIYRQTSREGRRVTIDFN